MGSMNVICHAEFAWIELLSLKWINRNLSLNHVNSIVSLIIISEYCPDYDVPDCNK